MMTESRLEELRAWLALRRGNAATLEGVTWELLEEVERLRRVERAARDVGAALEGEDVAAEARAVLRLQAVLAKGG